MFPNLITPKPHSNRLHPIICRSSEVEKNLAAKSFASKLRERWRIGQCSDDIIIIVDIEDKKVRIKSKNLKIEIKKIKINAVKI